jgi:hypothetical protein
LPTRLNDCPIPPIFSAFSWGDDDHYLVDLSTGAVALDLRHGPRGLDCAGGLDYKVNVRSF